MNPGLPLTENQKKRLLDLKEGEKKRAAKAVDAPAAEHPPLDPYAARFSNPLTTWAILCKDWQNGECRRGVSCRFQHDGFPIEQKRCFTCKSPEHSSKECTCLGGGADPQKDKHWEEYRARKLKAAENLSGKQPPAAAGIGQKGKGNGKSKSKRKGKDKGQKGKDPTTKACVVQSEQLQLEGAVAHFPETAWLWTAGPMCGSSIRRTCLQTSIKMYSILHMASAIATGRPPQKGSQPCMCHGQSLMRTFNCFQKVFCGNVDAASFVGMISL